MGEFRKLTVAIDEGVGREIADAVESGDYADEAEVVRHIIGDWARHRRGRELERLRAAFAEGLASGEPVEGNFDPEEVKRRGRERSAARHA